MTAVEAPRVPTTLPASSCPVCGRPGSWLPAMRAVVHAGSRPDEPHGRTHCAMPPLDCPHPEAHARGRHSRKEAS